MPEAASGGTIGVFAYIEDAGKKVLLVKDFSRQQLWTLPGGTLDFRELVPDCLKREVKEEAAIDIEPVKLLGIFSQRKSHGIVILMESKILSGIPTPDHRETSECRFFSLEELLAMRDQVKPAQLSMISQVKKASEADFPIFNHFIEAYGRSIS